MSSGTKNLGQVSGLFIGQSAPQNTSLIWWDSTPAVQCHKVYDFASNSWKVLQGNVISSITYDELVTIAEGDGFTLGSWYKITDMFNVIALAITATKLQYVDTNGNPIIDDVTIGKTYTITSDNLYVDDIQGVFDVTTKTVKFTFDDKTTPSANDYLFGKRNEGGVWGMIKIKLQKLVSTVTNNAITWNNGLYMNFKTNLDSYKDVSGGVVGKETFDNTMQTFQSTVENVVEGINDVIDEAKSYTDQKTSSNEIYSKILMQNPTQGTASDIQQGDSLFGIISKIQRWFNSLKFSSGIQVDQNFAPSTSPQNINNGDTLLSALQKIQYYISEQSDGIKVGEDYSPVGITAFTKGDSVSKALSAIQNQISSAKIESLYCKKYDIIVGSEDGIKNLAQEISDWRNVHGSNFNPSILIKSGQYNVVLNNTNTTFCDLSDVNGEICLTFEEGVRIAVTDNITDDNVYGRLFLDNKWNSNQQNYIPLITVRGNNAQIYTNSIKGTRAFEGFNGIECIDLTGDIRFYRCKYVVNCYGSFANNGQFLSFYDCYIVNECYGTFCKCINMRSCRGYIYAPNNNLYSTSILSTFSPRNNDNDNFTDWYSPVVSTTTKADMTADGGWNTKNLIE